MYAAHVEYLHENQSGKEKAERGEEEEGGEVPVLQWKDEKEEEVESRKGRNSDVDHQGMSY